MYVGWKSDRQLEDKLIELRKEIIEEVKETCKTCPVYERTGDCANFHTIAERIERMPRRYNGIWKNKP